VHSQEADQHWPEASGKASVACSRHNQPSQYCTLLLKGFKKGV